MKAPLDTLPAGIPDDQGIRTLGWGLLEWALPRFIQPNGPRSGEKFRPTLRQVRFILWWYALDDNGEFIFRHAVRRLAKGSGKSPFAAFLSLCELCGPVRFSHWDDSVAGGAVGKVVHMPLVQIAATAEHQTKNTMRMVREFGAKKNPLAREYGLDPGKTVFYHPDMGGELQVLTSSAAGAEGAEPTCIIADELEHWTPSNGGVDFYEVLDRNLAKSNSRMIETCNSWKPGAGSVAETVWDSYIAQEEGKTRGETRILYDAIEAPDDFDIKDPDELLEALSIVYGDCPWVNLKGIRERIWDTKVPIEVSRRFYLNQRVSDSTAWTTPQKWGALAVPEYYVEDGVDIVMFFDGSKSGDATALIGCEVDSGHVFEIGIWEPADGSEVDAEEVDTAVMLAFERWHVCAFFADVREWESYVKTLWVDRHKDDLLLWAVPNGSPAHPIAWDMRGKGMLFAQAAELCEQEINNAVFTHDGSSVIARHVGNAQRKPYRQFVTVAKESPKSSKKIDAAVCVIGARMVRRLLLASNEWDTYKNVGKKSKTLGIY